ncbi:calcium-translocating P-type ATPase, PMCA-type family protein [Trichomonas vaginalis G3]|uniref:Calcium-transporting ATPase n=1 Tax=Trichomonas vaginalis (strain ATCC PRA-98 / G3) TaxID=412133 RepID=A2FSW9_TRIV3|nr:calcium-transporting ATPase protein [Trichomonas vaginalis G3]EAX91991.1 calcium-translocating P-type ATPase, PMCA-type family protein [Trichomonas vaginalis G3]KAI5528946.1 calcium-transporting ATPase protein [Trichomonas vaginalis G3]|eukprot:XP_001304921.1 calcium-translocating P-type ATPase, PMCA-type family protein [Trichomonas vaginalis G3]
MTQLEEDLSPEHLEKILVDEDDKAIDTLGGVECVATKVNSDIKKGLSKNQLEKQESKYGSNSVPVREVPSIWQMLLDALDDATLKILIACAICSLILETTFATPEERGTAWIDGAAILCAVSVVSLVQAFSNHDQALQFAKINRCNYIYPVHVIRDGFMNEIKSSEVLVGDIIILSPGDKIPADGIIIDSDSLEIDTSAATGESKHDLKSLDNPFLLSGTLVSQGRGKYLVLCVGKHSNFGRIFATLNEEQKQTPLQDKLEDLAENIGYAGMIVAVVSFVALFLHCIYMRVTTGWKWSAAQDLLEYLVGALSIVVVAVPEGLPLAVTISLAYSMKKMMKDNNFVRHLRACETMGSATVICTDKTGTLTLNEMNVEKVIIGDQNIDAKDKEQISQSLLDKIIESIAVNSTAEITEHGSFGTQTECALLRYVISFGADIRKIRDEHSDFHQYQFSTLRKTMSTYYKSNQNTIVSAKGAWEYILGQCKSYYSKDGKIYDLSNDVQASMKKVIEAGCRQSYRMMAVAMKEVESVPRNQDDAESNLTLLCVFAIRDSLRPSTPSAIAECQHAGIRVIMITGDNPLTATAIANDCGIQTGDRSVLTGDDLRGKSEKEIEDLVKSCCVVARAKPLDKYAVVNALQRQGEIVAVTGDGTNDAPALHTADVGLSMGICGTELAKEASDIVILDDNFKSIVSSVMWGRCIYNNVRRFLQFQLTANVGTLFISFLSSVILQDTPFKAVQLLWINMIMDSLGALALATSMPQRTLLHRPPNDREVPLISRFMIKNIGSQSFYQILLMMILLVFHGQIEARSVHHYTLIFNVFVYCQVFNLINARVVDREDKIFDAFFSNPLFLIIMGGIAIVEFILVQLCGKFFASEKLSLSEWIFSVSIGAFCVPYGLVVRALPINIFNQIVDAFDYIKGLFIKSE